MSAKKGRVSPWAGDPVAQTEDVVTKSSEAVADEVTQSSEAATDEVVSEPERAPQPAERVLVQTEDVMQAALPLFSVALAYEDALINLGSDATDFVVTHGTGGFRWIYPEGAGRLYAEQQGWSPVDHVALLGLEG